VILSMLFIPLLALPVVLLLARIEERLAAVGAPVPLATLPSARAEEAGITAPQPDEA